MQRYLGHLLAVLLAMLTTAAVQASEAALAELAAQRAVWGAAGIASYEYGYNKFCECNKESPPETLITAGPDGVTDVRHKHVDSDRIVPAEPSNFYLYWTIDDLFDLVGRAIQREAVVRVEYDAELGYPSSFFIDYDAELIGDEVDVRITKFSAQSP